MAEGQSHGLSGLFIKPLEWTAIGLFLAALASVSVGLSAVAHGLWALFQHGHYAGQEFRLAINRPELDRKVFAIDKSWWLTLILPALAFQSAGAIWKLSEWVALDPQERQQRREKVRAEAKAKGDDARAALRARDDQARIDKEEQRRVKMNKSPMSGWRRLWIVLSVLLGVPAFAIAYGNASKAYVYEEPSDYVKTLQGQGYADAYFAEAKRSHTELNACILSTARVEGNSITCDRDPYNAALAGIGWALLPAMIMMAFGLTIRWVYRGFRSPKASADVRTSDPA